MIPCEIRNYGRGLLECIEIQGEQTLIGIMLTNNLILGLSILC